MENRITDGKDGLNKIIERLKNAQTSSIGVSSDWFINQKPERSYDLPVFLETLQYLFYEIAKQGMPNWQIGNWYTNTFHNCQHFSYQPNERSTT